MVCKQGFVPTRGSRLCSWPWEKCCFIAIRHKKREMVFIVSLIDLNISCIDFWGFNHAALCQGWLPISSPWTEYSCCRQRETANAAIYSYPSMKETRKSGPPPPPPPPPPSCPVFPPLSPPPPSICLITQSHMDAQCVVLIRPQGVVTHWGLEWL